VLAKNVAHYIFISTISVYRDNSIPNMDETGALHSYDGKDAMAETRATLMANMALYGPLKAECEREAQKRFGKKCTIIRPGLIVGPGDETDRFSYWPLRMEQGGDVLAPPADDPVQFIDARDLAEWTVRVAEQRAFGVFNATGPDYPLSVAAMLYAARAATTAGANIRFTDAEFLAKQQVAPWAELPVWVPGSGETAGLARTNIDRAKAAGLQFRSLADTVAATLEWFHAQLAERQQTLRAGIKPDKEATVLKALQSLKS
jgi:2'-hydroxyisoflavone reductase